MKNKILIICCAILLGGCAGKKDLVCTSKDVRDYMFVTDDNSKVQKIIIKDYSLSIDLDAYEKTLVDRQDNIDFMNQYEGVLASFALEKDTLIYTTTYDLSLVSDNIKEQVVPREIFGDSLALSSVIEVFESQNYICE